MIERNLTGKVRYRLDKRLFRKPLLVLQVEVHATGYYIDYPGSPVDVDDKYWRDGRIEDFAGRQELCTPIT